MKKNILLTTCAFAALSMFGPSAWAAASAASGAAAGNGTTIGELVVTAERRETNLQDTPIAVSAFSADKLKNERLDGGQNLVLQVPNTNYSRSNFGGFNLKIRGIGVDVVANSGTTGVSINENELPVAFNNFAQTDFYDVQRVEVLRGPQGTLYGRNAVGGAVDIITTQPSSSFGGFGSIQYGNYNALKVTGAVNIPLGDAFAVRIAGFRYTQDGFGDNVFLHQRVDGRDLGSIRTTLRFKPNDRFEATLMYEHYGEDDNRNRIGKQLCIKDPGPANIGGVPIAPAGGPVLSNYAAFLNQGCLPGSLNQASAYGAPNSNATFLAAGNLVGLNNGTDVYAGVTQDHNLHDISSITQPRYTSQQELVELHLTYHLNDSLTLSSITGFNKFQYSSAEDYNRFQPSAPFTPVGNSFFGALPLFLFPGGVVNDPQIGPGNKLATFDLSTAASKEYTEEVRLASSFQGRFNFSAGLFYSEITSPNDANNYFVFSNALTGFSQANNAAGAPFTGGVPIYIDPSSNPAGTPPALAGHNYYDNHSGGGGYLKSYAGFGEAYYNFTPTLKLTLGGRYTVDQLLNNSYPITVTTGGTGFPALPATQCPNAVSSCVTAQKVTYREFTGRANLDWTPVLTFTDKTLIYASYSRGYKGGGFNTPCQVGGLGVTGGQCPYPIAYNPEFINAYEVGTKNTLLGGSLQLNLTGFYYDYKGYQISTIVDKSSVNLNINAKIYGAEFESIYSPFRNFTLNANVGYLHTAIDNGQFEIDTINLTQGNSHYTLLHANDGTACLAPTALLASEIAGGVPAPFLSSGLVPGLGQIAPGACVATGAANVSGYTAINASIPGYVDPANVNGVPQNLGGHKLPNSPEFTVSGGAQYVVELPGDWRATLRGDLYWQDNSFARIFNAVNDQLRSYYNFNATLTFANLGEGLDLQFYVKNAFNAQPITGVYLTNDTSGLFQNVFTLDPRTYGAQLTKRF